MSFFNPYTLWGWNKDSLERQTVLAFEHFHGEDLTPHSHLVGGESRYLEWIWDMLRRKGEHIHQKVEI